MADEPFARFRLLLMQDFLPVSLAIMDRARRGGSGKVVEAFKNSKDPFLELREEGEAAAKTVRDRLDQINPGLGNPVVAIDVEVDDEELDSSNEMNEDLKIVLDKINIRLGLLENYLSGNSTEASDLNEDEA